MSLSRRRIPYSGIWDTADMEPVRVALHADSSQPQPTLDGTNPRPHPLIEAAWTLRQEWRRDHPPSEWERYSFRWEMNRTTWWRLTEEARHADPHSYALHYPITPDERVSLFGWPILLADHLHPDGTWRIDLIVERLPCPDGRHAYRWLSDVGRVGCTSCGWTVDELPPPTTDPDPCEGRHNMRVDMERGVIRCTRCGHQLGPSGYDCSGFIREAARAGMFAVPPHPRTQAINDEFGWEDAHNNTASRGYDPWTGEDIE